LAGVVIKGKDLPLSKSYRLEDEYYLTFKLNWSIAAALIGRYRRRG
jgi:hypothetical protein